MAPRTDLLILGAGPAGLAYAARRMQADPQLDFRIVDAEPTPGGWVQTRRIEGYVCEMGPQGIRPTEQSDEFLAAFDLTDSVVPAAESAKNRFVARGGRLHPLPAGPKGLKDTRLFTLFGKLRLFGELFVGKGTEPEESLAEFAARRFGRQTVPLAETMASGIFGGDAHLLEMGAAFPAVVDMEQEHGSLIKAMKAKAKAKRKTGAAPAAERPALISFGGGMDTMVRHLRTLLGSRLLLGREATAIAKSDAGWTVTLGGDAPSEILARELALAIPARRAAPLLQHFAPDLAAELTAIPYASIANIYLGFRDVDGETSKKLGGFGFLLDRREGTEMLGAIYCSSIFPSSAPDERFLVRVMSGGMVHPNAVTRDEEALARDAEALVRKYTGLESRLEFKRVYKTMDAIPQYVRGHRARVDRIEALAADRDLQLLGNSYHEVSLSGQLR